MRRPTKACAAGWLAMKRGTASGSGFPVPGSGSWARRNSRSSSGVRATNPSTELARMSALLPSGSRNFTAIDRTPGAPSCTAGLPLLLANRMVAGTGGPAK